MTKRRGCGPNMIGSGGSEILGVIGRESGKGGFHSPGGDNSKPSKGSSSFLGSVEPYLFTNTHTHMLIIRYSFDQHELTLSL